MTNETIGQISFFDGQNPLKINKPIRLVELFAGIGAQARALEKLGVPFEHYRICEFDRAAVASYNAVHGTNFQTSDITKIHARDLNITDTDKYFYILTYSFPCTDLSTAGKQAGMQRGGGTRSGLLWEVERLLKEMDELPQVLLMENVPAVVSDKFIGDFTEWVDYLAGIGYRNKYMILNAKDYGVPQNRERCFMVSWLGDFYYDFPAPRPLKLRLKDMLEEAVDKSFFLSEERITKLLMYEEKLGNNDTDRIIVAGTLDPDKEVQDRIRIINMNGICPALRATDYKDPQKIVLRADGIYTRQTEQFMRGPIKDVSRTLKAQVHDAGVVLYGD